MPASKLGPHTNHASSKLINLREDDESLGDDDLTDGPRVAQWVEDADTTDLNQSDLHHFGEQARSSQLVCRTVSYLRELIPLTSLKSVAESGMTVFWKVYVSGFNNLNIRRLRLRQSNLWSTSKGYVVFARKPVKSLLGRD